MKKGLILTIFVSLIFLSGCVLKKVPLENNPADNIQRVACPQEAKICPDGSTVSRTGANCDALCPDSVNMNQDANFIFAQDYRVEQDDYSNGGDWPTGKIVTLFKKGDIVSGKYGSNGCRGEGCVPDQIVSININGQNWPVDNLILQPLPASDVLKDVDCPVGKNFFDEICVCPSPWDIRIGNIENGFQCVGMPDDSRR